MKLTFGTLLDSDSMLFCVKMYKTQTAHSNNTMNQITIKGHLNSFWFHFRHCLFRFFIKGLKKISLLLLLPTLDKHFSLIKLRIPIWTYYYNFITQRTIKSYYYL